MRPALSLLRCGIGLGLQIAALTLLFAIGLSDSAQAEESSLINYQHGDKLPSFTLPNIIDRREVAIATASGKPTVLMFFSVTPPFRGKRSLSLADEIAKLKQQYGDRVQFVSIFSDEQRFDQAKQYAEEKLLPSPVLDDSLRKLYNRYGVFMLPITVVIGGSGELHAVIPFTYGVGEMLDHNLKYLLGEWDLQQLKNSFMVKKNIVKTKEEKEYIRRVNYGRVMLKRKMLPAALREFTTATKIITKPIEALNGIGFVQMAGKKYAAAEQTFLKALQVDKDHDEALAGYGLALYYKGEVDKALPHLENALISFEQNLEVIIALAAIYEERGLITKAIRLNKLAVQKLLYDVD